jgi:hypothetical protein
MAPRGHNKKGNTMESGTHTQALGCITEDSFQNIKAVSTALLMLSENENEFCIKGAPMMIFKLSDYLENAARAIEKAIDERDDLDGLGRIQRCENHISVFDCD